MKRHLVAILALALVASACDGSTDPAADSSTTSSTVVSTSSTTTTEVVGQFCPSSPFRDPGESVRIRRIWVTECEQQNTDWIVQVRSDQWITFMNTGTDAWDVQLGDYTASIPAGETLDSPPVDVILIPGSDYPLGATTVVNIKDVTFGPLDGAEILLQRIGPVGPGQTLGEVTAVARHPVDLDETYEFFLPDCATGTFRGADGLYMLFAGNGTELRLQYIEITSPGLATRSGVEVGGTAEEVIGVYGDQVEYRNDFGSFDGRNLVFVPETEDRFGLVFLLDEDGTVRGIRQGLADAVGLTEGCA